MKKVKAVILRTAGTNCDKETAFAFREAGAEAVQGPLGFTNLDLQGLLIEGFDQLPSIASVYHLPYYGVHIENLGYRKDNDWVEFRLFLSPGHR